jgi:hypothetical protein
LSFATTPANAKGLAKESIAHLRRLLSRFFKSLEKDEIIAANPVRLVELGDVGRMKQDTRGHSDARYLIARRPKRVREQLGLDMPPHEK